MDEHPDRNFITFPKDWINNAWLDYNWEVLLKK